jgi:filamentous hemagglutinin family protein
MKPVYLASTLQISPLIVAAAVLSEVNPALSQVVPDDTLGAESSVVNPRDENSDSIDGGAVRGQNLFHSFQEFNVREGRGVYFANPDAVSNIFSRVTGGNSSNILGVLGVDGAANLYLINPNGIIFGEGAALDVQGSFTATTADGIEFGDNGFFSAVAPGESLLTISVPLGLQLGLNPGNIVNRSFSQDETGDFVGLQVPSGENLTLIGGDISFEAGEATARGGKIFIGGLSEVGTVAIDEDGSLSFPESVARADILLTNAADVDVRGTGGGSVTVNARNIDIEAGDFGSSQIRAGIIEDSTSPEAQAGDITINATGAVNLVDGSQIKNSVEVGAIGNSGNVELTAETVTLTNGASLDTRTSGVGDAGDVSMEAEEITFSSSTLVTEVSSDGGIGNAGDINISTNSLSLQNGSFFLADTENQGDAGNILINAEDSVVLEGIGEDNSQNQITSTVDAGINLDVTGNAGNIEINTGSLSISDRGFISTDTSGEGDGGSILVNADDSVFLSNSNIYSDVNFGAVGNSGGLEINGNSLSLENGAAISSNTYGEGNSGKITINVSESVYLDNGVGSTFIFNNIYSDARGNSKGIDINTGSLFVNNGAQIQSLTEGEGNSGKIVIQANDIISFDGRDIGDSPSGAFSLVLPGGKGNAGGLEIIANSFFMTNRAQILSNTEGAGNAGNVDILVEDKVNLVNSTILAEVTEGTGVGKGGDINITTKSLLLKDGSSLLVDTENVGNAGEINIQASERVVLEGEGLGAFPNDTRIVPSQITSTVDSFEGAKGNGGNINISTAFLSITDGGFIRTSTFGLGNAGNVKIEAENVVVSGFDEDGFGSLIASSVGRAEAEGNGSNVEIITNNLSVTNAGQISVSTSGAGDAGDLSIFANNIEINGGEDNLFTGLFAQVNQNATGEGGSINLGSEQSLIEQLTLVNGARISADTFDEGNAGGINIYSSGSISLENSNIFSEVNDNAVGNAGTTTIVTNILNLTNGSIIGNRVFGEGEGGNINLGSEQSPIEQLELTNGAQITVSTSGRGKAGELKINANSFNLNNDAFIASRSESAFDAGDITLNIANSLQATDSEISTSSTQSSGGNLTIAAGNIELRGNSDLTTNVESGAGGGGNITLTADSIIAFENSDIFAFARDGRGGNITLNTPAFFAENFTLNSLTSNPNILDENNRADVNATGAVSGSVSIPDVSFIQNSLTELPNNSLDTDELVANSCVVPAGDRGRGTFIITGGESLPVRPGDNLPSKYPTGEVRNVPENNDSSWQPGDPIIEPQGVYRLTNGKLVLSRECN